MEWYMIVMFNDGMEPELYGPYAEDGVHVAAARLQGSNSRVEKILITTSSVSNCRFLGWGGNAAEIEVK